MSTADDLTPISNDALTGERRLLYEVCIKPLQKDIREGFARIHERLDRVEMQHQASSAVVGKVEDQVRTLAADMAETDRTVSRDGERITALERTDGDRRVRAEEQAIAAARDERSDDKSLGNKAVEACVLGAAGGIGLAVLALLWWIVSRYVKDAP